MRPILAALFALLLTPAVAAAEFEPVREKQRFLSLVEGRELRMPLYGLKLQVLPDGRIRGSALGWGVTGSWSWRDGYFCREMDWSGMAIPYNCQLVEARGGQELRFTVDRGAGDSARFRLD
jgi:hypothetical protein